MNDDTIAAISTPLGEGGIGIVRLSGRDAVSIVEKLFSSPKNKKLSESESHKLIHGFIKNPSTNTTIDEVLVTVMKAPKTYTKEDVVEINCHGGILPLREVLELVLRSGARPAEPGEFTKRAFLNGRIDLSQAEAVIDLIRAKTDESRRVAVEQLSGGLSEKITSLRDRIASICAHIEAYIDFPEEEIEPASLESILNEIQDIKNGLSILSNSFEEGRFFREGFKIAIVGRPNVGKSSLLNALLNRDRAIVTETPGTTRDLLEEYLNVKGLPVRIMDTAGIRETHEMAEREGVMRSLKAIDDADLIIGIIDGTTPLNNEDMVVLEKIKDKKNIIAINKSDLPPHPSLPLKGGGSGWGFENCLKQYSQNVLMISAKTGEGLDTLKDKILDVSLIKSQKLVGATLSEDSYREVRSPFDESEGVIVTNIRHKVAIDNGITALNNVSAALRSLLPLEIVAMEMRDALDRLGEIVGSVTTEDILNRIFSEFCIGK
ncbi:MAG: tRNA uridine-5-carboxymethylaminomethyl(34) synthesis GTPase MnmE [Nitrospirae bacterium]|nr:tRNA uridine-5-carboxymethylaminomethyl(34) synthesis GTPase MnmE [Nitrospirota bacterium]MCL5423316.1 tRNA uridine-5-carboxymethylaminomethyl(34) synthesis GTPase MnmE [Nitrospirota bacterium]